MHMKRKNVSFETDISDDWLCVTVRIVAEVISVEISQIFPKEENNLPSLNQAPSEAMKTSKVKNAYLVLHESKMCIELCVFARCL